MTATATISVRSRPITPNGSTSVRRTSAAMPPPNVSTRSKIVSTAVSEIPNRVRAIV